MQNTLLALAIAVILALIAALVGPLLIDWGNYRPLFEAEASRLIGLQVRVEGEIDARLLPSPQITLHELEIGAPGAEPIRARALNVEFALASLMRGEWQASNLHLTGPQVRVALDKSGHIKAPNLTIGFKPDALTIDRLSIEDGRLTLVDEANGGTVTLDKLYFNGQAASLLGPYRGEGDAVIGGSHYPYRLAAGRVGEDGALKLKLNVDPREHPVNFETSGTLSLAADGPKFDGKWSLIRPAGISASGTGELSQPWQLSGIVKAQSASALFEKIDFAYGSEEHGLKLTGLADFTFGASPRLNLLVSGNQIDLDRTLATAQDGRSSPGAVVRRLAEFAAGAFRTTVPIQIGVGIDRVMLAGDTVQNVRGDITADAAGWNLKSFEFRAPGFTQARLSGHLDVAAAGVTFTGPAEIDSHNPKMLAAWLEGRPPAAQGELRPLSLRGRLTLGSDKIALDRLTAEFARKTITGRFAYIFAAGTRPSRLDAALDAPELDLDLALGFGKALLAGSQLERPRELAITADIGRATLGGIQGRNISVRVKADADHWEIDRLAVADLGGASFSASGRLLLAQASPQGNLRVDLDARDLAPVTALLVRFAPKTAQALDRGAAAMAPAQLHADLNLDGSTAKLGVDGHLGTLRLALTGEGRIDPKTLDLGDVRLESKLSTDDGKALVRVLGLDTVLSVDEGSGALTILASGPARGALQVEARLTASGLDAAIGGTARPFAGDPKASLRATIVRANAAPLRGQPGVNVALPVTFVGNIAVAGENVTLGNVAATVAGTPVRGNLAVTLTSPHRLSGAIDADRIDGAALLAAAFGARSAETTKTSAAWAWSDSPFAGNRLHDVSGQVTLKARQVDLLPHLAAREFSATLHFAGGEAALNDMAGVIVGGQLSGALSFRSDDQGLKAHAKLALAGADTTGLLRAPARPPVSGALDLILDVEGTGLSPAALIGSLHGAGKLTLANAELAGLDPHAFEAVTRAVDAGVAVDADRISDIVRKALESGRLSVAHAEGAIAVSAGQLRVSDVAVQSTYVALTMSGALDLTDGTIDARLVLSGAATAGGVRPDIFMALSGPLPAPSRYVDVSALTGWLTLRAVENQARQIRAIEDATPKPAVPPAAKAPPDKQSKAPALPPPVAVRPAPRAGEALVGPQN